MPSTIPENQYNILFRECFYKSFVLRVEAGEDADWLRWSPKEKKETTFVEQLPLDAQGKVKIVPSDDPDYQPKLSWAQLQNIMSGRKDVK